MLDHYEPIGGCCAVLLDASTEIVLAGGAVAAPESLAPGQLVEVAGIPLPWNLLHAQRVVTAGKR